jgi:hypothetical protein
MLDDINNLIIINTPYDEILQTVRKGEKDRQLPALWTAELNFSEEKLYIRFLSDISGKCFHDSIQLAIPLNLLFQYGNKLKVCLYLRIL